MRQTAVSIGATALTPLGEVWVAVTGQGLVAVEYQTGEQAFTQRLHRRGFTPATKDPAQTKPYTAQISEYLEGNRQAFDLPVDWSVLSPFQQQVLQATFAIPFGRVATYGEIAHQISKPGAARAVGRAEATNPMPLVIPCHRVLSTAGQMHGYSGPGGVTTKAWLLNLEGRA